MAKRDNSGFLGGMPDGSAVQMLRQDRTAYCSVWEGERVLDGFATIGRVEAELSRSQDDPYDRPRQFEKARQHWKHQWFIREIIKLRYAFFHYGFRVGSESDASEKERDQVKKWARNTFRMHKRYARECWLEWLVMDNVVGLWRRKGLNPPVVFPVENCKFEDPFGMESLEITHGLTQEKLSLIGTFTKVEENAFQKIPNKLKITHDDKVFGFDVLRRERLGSGFGIPTIAPLFTTAAEMTSLDVSGAGLAAACRTIYEQHKMGHEIKSGIHAGSKAHFWNKTRAQAFESSVKGKTGHIRITTNFDHEVVYPRPDPKYFAASRYESAIQRMAIWSMPLGQMLLNKSINPVHMTMLKQQAIAEREYVGEHLQTMFVQALGAPASVKLFWSNRCFTDPRIAAELLKFALQSGPLSQRTFLDEGLGTDPDEERSNKDEEAKLPKSQTTPIFDAAHGDPGGRPPKPAGRKPGTKDGEGD